MDEKYFPEEIEEKWQKHWTESGAFQVKADSPREKFYPLEMLPYFSGVLLKGDVRDYSIGDALAWYKRLQGFEVLYPIGWDSFEQLAEQAAIKENSVSDDWSREMIAAFGADATRLFVLFASPPKHELRWSESGVEGAVRFLRRVYNLVFKWRDRFAKSVDSDSSGELGGAARDLRRKTHQTIVKITHNFERLHFNASVAALMELLNQLSEFNGDSKSATPEDVFAVREALEAMVVMLAPFAPHVAEEMWEGLGHQGGLLNSSRIWPIADTELAKKSELEVPIQVNGKLRSKLAAAPNVSEAELEIAALADAKIQSLIEGHQVVKVIVVPQRLVNIVIK